MKVVYLDTNLYVALIKKNDINYSNVITIISQPHLIFVTSTITLVELSSVLSREYNNLQLDQFLDDFDGENNEMEQSMEIIFLIIEYLILKTKTTIIPDSQIEPITYFQQQFMISPIFKIAMLESSKIQLRTLDLIHYANSFHYKTIQNNKIDYILSADTSFISKGQSYLGTKSITFIDPITIIKLECR